MTNSTPDDDRTLQAGASSARESRSGQGERLPLGTRLAEFEIKGFVGEGGFSIVYLAWDHSLDRRVALKEYMPASLAARDGGLQVSARSERHLETFDAGLKSFINESKLLAQFDHPSLVKVYRFWEQNGTAYMVMPFYEGVTLKQAVLSMAEPPDEQWLRRLLEPLTAALRVLHDVQCFHRDVAPDNVLLLAESGKPLLLDFGAARRVIGDKTQALTVILKPGYAPIEQYADDPAMKQGAWTDVYALAATVYWSVTGKTPPTSVGRVVNDAYVPLVQCAADCYSRQFLVAIDHALRVLPDQRTPSIERLRDELGLGIPTARADAVPRATLDPDATVLLNAPRFEPTASPSREEALSETKRKRGLGMVFAASAVLMGALGIAWWTQRPLDAPKVAARPAPPPTQVPVPPPSPAPAPTATSAAQALSELIGRRDVSIDVTARQLADRGNTRPIQYQSSEGGYVYVLGMKPGIDELVLLHPTPGRAPTKLALSGVINITSSEAASLQQPYLLIAREPRDLANAGWVQRKQTWVRSFGVETVQSWGLPRCGAEVTVCDAAYGMTEVIKVTNVMPPSAVPAGLLTREAGPPNRPKKSGKQEPAPTPRDASASERKPRATSKAECVEALRRASLGDASQELIDKLKSLDCR